MTLDNNKSAKGSWGKFLIAGTDRILYYLLPKSIYSLFLILTFYWLNIGHFLRFFLL